MMRGGKNSCNIINCIFMMWGIPLVVYNADDRKIQRYVTKMVRGKQEIRFNINR